MGSALVATSLGLKFLEIIMNTNYKSYTDYFSKEEFFDLFKGVTEKQFDDDNDRYSSIFEFGYDEYLSVRYADISTFCYETGRRYMTDEERRIESVSSMHMILRGYEKVFRKFLIIFFEEIRARICDKDLLDNSNKNDYGKAATAVISTFIANEFGVESALATATAAGVLVVLFDSSKGAFCKMTKDELAKRLKEIDKNN